MVLDRYSYELWLQNKTIPFLCISVHEQLKAVFINACSSKMDWPCVLYNTNIGIVWRRRKQRPQSTTKIISALSLNSSSSTLLILLLLAIVRGGVIHLKSICAITPIFVWVLHYQPSFDQIPFSLTVTSVRFWTKQQHSIHKCMYSRTFYLPCKTLPFQENISYFRKRYKRIKLEKVPLAESVLNLFQRFTIFHNIGILKLKFMFKYKRQSRNENYLWKLNKYACL